ncbi:hypothetical protein EG352_09875 [Chryseobacterium indologenes]|uniref:Uncharacterized protein n=1 Tax=Chryseobacterium indologenes TaxID=253 RepID=A0AAD1DVD0_CHRID|nr:hypothetical protein EG352_09875 [Chryseobacterium indologenes]
MTVDKIRASAFAFKPQNKQELSDKLKELQENSIFFYDALLFHSIINTCHFQKLENKYLILKPGPKKKNRDQILSESYVERTYG